MGYVDQIPTPPTLQAQPYATWRQIRIVLTHSGGVRLPPDHGSCAFWRWARPVVHHACMQHVCGCLIVLAPTSVHDRWVCHAVRIVKHQEPTGKSSLCSCSFFLFYFIVYFYCNLLSMAHANYSELSYLILKMIPRLRGLDELLAHTSLLGHTTTISQTCLMAIKRLYPTFHTEKSTYYEHG
jgi:hypothetical protein